MKPKSAIARGKILEDYVASQIREKGIDLKAYRSHGSGNTNNEKGDIWTSMMILGQNAGIECKNHKTLAIPDWWRQTKKLESLGREPVLVFKLPHDPLEGTLATIYLDTLLELIKAANGAPPVAQNTTEMATLTPNQARTLKYELQRNLTQLKALIKVLEQVYE